MTTIAMDSPEIVAQSDHLAPSAASAATRFASVLQFLPVLFRRGLRGLLNGVVLRISLTRHLFRDEFAPDPCVTSCLPGFDRGQPLQPMAPQRGRVRKAAAKEKGDPGSP